MEKLRMKKEIAVFIFAIILVFVDVVSAANIGISPASINFKQVLRKVFYDPPKTNDMTQELDDEGKLCSMIMEANKYARLCCSL